MRKIFFVLTALLCAAIAAALISMQGPGQPESTVVSAPAETPPEPTWAELPLIVIIDEPDSPATVNAARELAAYLRKSTGRDYPIRKAGDADTSTAAAALIVGNGPLARELGVAAEIDSLAPDGVLIKQAGPHVVIAGQGNRGTLYAVYEFLERFVGYRWWSAVDEKVPKHESLKLANGDYRYEPRFTYRVPYTEEVKRHPAFAVKMRASGLAHEPPLPPEWGGSMNIVGFVHSFDPLVPAREYYPKHPEWGAFRQGQRLSWTQHHAQPCLSNKAFLNELTRRALERLEGVTPPAMITVSQNDNQNRCLCEKCLAIEKEEGSPAGPIIRFVNEVAAAVGATHPGILVDTLAYTYSSVPPKKVKPADNVAIRLSTYHENHARAFTHADNRAFREKLETWAAISRQLYIWDYTTDFNDQWVLRPNLLKLGPNIRLFAESGAKGVFSQGAFRQRTDFAALRNWLVSRLLWNPEQDDRALIREFLDGYYGKAAAPYLWEYLLLIEETAASTPMLMNGGGIARIGFGNAFHTQAARLFDQAEAAAAQSTQSQKWLERVRIERLAPEYLRVVDYPASIQQGSPLFTSPEEALAASEAVAEKIASLGLGDRDRYVENKLELYKIRTLPVQPPPPALINGKTWLDFTAPNLRLNGFNRIVFLQEEPDSSSGYVAATPAGQTGWNIQLTANPEIVDQQWNAHIRLKYVGEGSAGITFGGYDIATEKKTNHTTATLKSTDGFQWVELRNTPFTERSYLYLSVTSGTPEGRVLVDRITLVKP